MRMTEIIEKFDNKSGKSKLLPVIACCFCFISCFSTSHQPGIFYKNDIPKPSMVDRTLLIIPLEVNGEKIPDSVTRNYDISIVLATGDHGFPQSIYLYFRNFPAGYQVVKGLPQSTYSVKAITLLTGLERSKLFKFDSTSFTMKEKDCVIFPLKISLSIREALNKGDKYPALELKNLSEEEKIALKEDLIAKYPDFRDWQTK